MSLVHALNNASALHTHGDIFERIELMSPGLASSSSRSSRDYAVTSQAHEGPEYDAIWTSTVTLDGTTMDDDELPRERFAYWCFDLLFLMCSRAPGGKCPWTAASDYVARAFAEWRNTS